MTPDENYRQASVHSTALLDDVKLGEDTKIWAYSNCYGCTIGSECMIGPFVEIQRGVSIGDRSRVQSHSFLCTKVNVGDDVFIGHGVMTVNNRSPPGPESKWEPIEIGDGAVIGSGAVIMPVSIGKDATVGAGAVVVDDIPPGDTVVGNPARSIESDKS